MAALEAFAKDVGDDGPVVCVGGRTQWDVGGRPDTDAREVRAPAGVVAFEPADMTVRVRAGTTVAELAGVLAEKGQMVPLDPATDPERATVGGVLAVGHSGIRRLRYGPIRDTVLEARFVTAEGKVAKAGGPVVKNVSGYDLCRVLVGSLGTLGFIGEVVLRAQPRPADVRWYMGGPGTDPFAARRLFRPSSILWDGASTWVLIEGHPADIDAEAAALGPEFTAVEGPPPWPTGPRLSVRPSAIRETVAALDGPVVAEIGVGTIHSTRAEPEVGSSMEPSTLDLNQRVKHVFDPHGRMNPGRRVP